MSAAVTQVDGRKLSMMPIASWIYLYLSLDPLTISVPGSWRDTEHKALMPDVRLMCNEGHVAGSSRHHDGLFSCRCDQKDRYLLVLV